MNMTLSRFWKDGYVLSLSVHLEAPSILSVSFHFFYIHLPFIVLSAHRFVAEITCICVS